MLVENSISNHAVDADLTIRRFFTCVDSLPETKVSVTCHVNAGSKALVCCRWIITSHRAWAKIRFGLIPNLVASHLGIGWCRQTMHVKRDLAGCFLSCSSLWLLNSQYDFIQQYTCLMYMFKSFLHERRRISSYTRAATTLGWYHFIGSSRFFVYFIVVSAGKLAGRQRSYSKSHG